MKTNNNKYKNIIKGEHVKGLMINDDLLSQNSQEDSDDDQIIQNEGKDEEYSFISNDSDNVNKNNNLNQIEKIKEFKQLHIDNIDNKLNDYKYKTENNIIKEETSDINITTSNNKDLANEANNNSNNNYNISESSNRAQNNQNNIFEGNLNLNGDKKNKSTKRPLYKKNVIKDNVVVNKSKNVINKNKNSNINKGTENNKNKDNKKNNDKFIFKNKKENILPLTYSNSKDNYLNKSAKLSNSKTKNSLLNNMKDKNNITNYKIGNSPSSRNNNRDAISSSRSDNKKNITASYDKYGNKINCIKNFSQNSGNTSNKKSIKLSKNINKNFNNNIHHNTQRKNQMNYSFNSNSYHNSIKKVKKINISNYRIKNDFTNKSSIFTGNSASVILTEKKRLDRDADVLKKLLINKINKQINEIIGGKEKLFFNENNKLFFLGFCDILFEFGFLHIKETEINDITNIKKHINELYTQPYTNRALLSEDFLFNEQKLLICAWKTILNNFNLIKEFDKLPQENEEISIDDCKLFIFIVTGLFIGYNKYEQHLNTDRKVLTKNKSSSNFSLSSNLKSPKTKGIYSKDNFSQKQNNSKISKSNNNSSKKSKYHFRKKSNNSKFTNISYNSNNDENILKNILENRKKSDYNYKNILKIKEFFSYFAELRKLYNLYQKDLKNINKKIDIDKELTFHPKTNKNNKILLNKFAPSLNFFERNALIKNRNNKKMALLQKERSQKMLKECTFEPIFNKKNKLSPKEISNRLYYSNFNKKTKPKFKSSNYNNINNYNTNANGNNKISSENTDNIYTSSDLYSSKKRIYSKNFLRNKNENNNLMPNNTNNTNTSVTASYSPKININFNRAMFFQSPLDKDELLSKRIEKLREANFKKHVENYEKNNREILSNSIKQNKELLKEIISLENKGMRMDIEKRTNKDTFDNFQNYDFLNYDNNLYNNDTINEPLFTVEIKIKDNIKTIEVYQDDQPEKLAYDFCVENMLGKGSFEKIVYIIKTKMEEINHGTFKEEVNYLNVANAEQNEEDEEDEQNEQNEENEENEKKSKKSNKKALKLKYGSTQYYKMLMKLPVEKRIEFYTNEELNDLDYKYAVDIDKRTFSDLYLSFLQKQNIIIFCFSFYNNDFNLSILKLSLLVFEFLLFITITTFFFTENILNNIYDNENEFGFSFMIKPMGFTILICYGVNFLVKFLLKTHSKLVDIKEERLDRKEGFKKIICKLIFYFLITLSIMTFGWFYVTCFCGIYRNTQMLLLKCALYSLGITFAYPFLICLIPTSLRIVSLNDETKSKECFYKASFILSFI